MIINQRSAIRPIHGYIIITYNKKEEDMNACVPNLIN